MKFCFCLSDEETGSVHSQHSKHSKHSSPRGSHRSRPQSHRETPAQKKKREMRENLEDAALELLNYFNHRNLDALLKVTRNTLEQLRKRITSSSLVHYLGKLNLT